MQEKTVQSEKKTYTTPTLSTHGDVAGLTQQVDGSGITVAAG